MIEILKILYILDFILLALGALMTFALFHHATSILKAMVKKPIIKLRRSYL